MRGKLRTTQDLSSQDASAPISPTSSPHPHRQQLRLPHDPSPSRAIRALQRHLIDALVRSHPSTKAKRARLMAASWLASIRPNRRHPPASASDSPRASAFGKAQASQQRRLALPPSCVQAALLVQPTRPVLSSRSIQHPPAMARLLRESTLSRAPRRRQRPLDLRPSTRRHLADVA